MAPLDGDNTEAPCNRSTRQAAPLPHRTHRTVSTTQCAFALSEVISYYNFNRSNVYTVFLDATKAFDRVNIGKLFRILIDKNIYMIVLRLLLKGNRHKPDLKIRFWCVYIP